MENSICEPKKEMVQDKSFKYEGIIDMIDPFQKSKNSCSNLSSQKKEQDISSKSLIKSKNEENNSNSNRSISNTSGNTPAGGMQKYFKIPNAHLFSFQKEFNNILFTNSFGQTKQNQPSTIKNTTVDDISSIC